MINEHESPTVLEFENNGKVMRVEMPPDQARHFFAQYDEAVKAGKDVTLQFQCDDEGNVVSFTAEVTDKEVEQ
jgi:hypothetical protein